VLVGFGAINGERINRYEVNGGGFFFDLDGGVATVSVDFNAILSQRFFPLSTMHIGFRPILSFNPPLEAGCDMSVRFTGSMEAIYGRTAYGTATINVLPELGLSRKAGVNGSSIIDARAAGQLDRRFVATWDPRRKIHVSAGVRGMFVTPQPRYHVIPGHRDILEKQKEDVIE